MENPWSSVHNVAVIFLAQILFFGLRNWPVAILAAVVVMAAVWWLYPPQVKALSVRWRWVLPALRAAALGALAMSLLKPVAARPKTAAEQGAIVVLVDRSKSMGVTDTARTEAEKVSLADGLGMIEPGVRSDRVDAMLGRLDQLRDLSEDVTQSHRELEIARLAGQGVEAAESRVTHASDAYRQGRQALVAQAAEAPKESHLQEPLSRLLPQESAGDDGDKRAAARRREKWGVEARERIATATRAAKAYRAASDRQLYESNALVRKAADAAGAMTRFELAEHALVGDHGLIAQFGASVPMYGYGVADHLTPMPLRGDSKPVRRLLVVPDGEGTDLTHNITAALEQMKGSPVRGIVLFSDGRQVKGDSTVATALSGAGVPVFAVAVAPMLASPDLSLVRVRVPSSSFVGETITIRADVRSVGLPAGEVSVHLRHGASDIVRKVMASANGIAPVEFSMKLTEAGAQRIELAVEARPGEISPANNKVERWVKVLSQKLHIGCYAGWAGWDFQYIRDALSRTPWVKLSEGVLPDGVHMPLTGEQIERLDLLILSDVPPEALSDGQWNAVQQLVKDRGASLMLLAGGAEVPVAYAQRLLLKELLPFPSDVTPVWRSWPGEAPFFHLVPGEGSQDLDALKLTDDQEEDAGWSRLPALYHYLALGALKPNVLRVLLKERDSDAPVLTESRLGLGRVFFFGANETWRWRRGMAGGNQNRFWLQLFRYAAEAPYAAQKGGLSLDVDRVSIEPGQSVHVRARVLDGQGKPSQAGEQRVEVMNEGRVLRTVMLTLAGASGSGRYEGAVSGLPEGTYTLKLVDPVPSAEAASVSLSLRVHRSDEAEMADLSSDYAFLSRLALSSGGQLMSLEQVGLLPEALDHVDRQRSLRAELPLWDSGWLFVFVLACLGCEWGLRKRFGLS